MKLVILIPCYNEESTLPQTLSDLPRELEGISRIEILVVDDGSSDETVRVAREHRVNHILQLKKHQGLAAAFSRGVEFALKLDADIILNTDGDNQYSARSIPRLIQPILNHDAEIVIGSRPIASHQEFSLLKKKLQLLGSWVVRKVSGTEVQDTTSGFRALSRSAARRINIFSSYTYTLEMIIQAGLSGIPVLSVPVEVNPNTRLSRLITSIPSYILKSLVTIFDVCTLYRARFFFSVLGAILFVLSFVIGLRFIYFYLTVHESGKIHSLILASILCGAGLSLFVTGLLANLISTNRVLLEKISERLFSLERKLGEAQRNGGDPPADSGKM